MASSPAPLPTASVTARRLTLDEMPTAARLCRAAYDRAFPWLAGRHGAHDYARVFATTIFAAGPVWAFAPRRLLGIVALRPGPADPAATP